MLKDLLKKETLWLFCKDGSNQQMGLFKTNRQGRSKIYKFIPEKNRIFFNISVKLSFLKC
jgi:hypothetical protein